MLSIKNHMEKRSALRLFGHSLLDIITRVVPLYITFTILLVNDYIGNHLYPHYYNLST